MNDTPNDTRRMNDDDATLRHHELASAYLDGEAEAHERATVEASPELLALVTSFEQVKNIVGQVPAAPVAQRETAITAALAEFDRQATVPAAPSNVVPFGRRQRWSKVLGVAAAVMLIGVVGVAAVNSFKDSTDSQSSSTAGDDQFTVAAGDAQKTASENSSARPTVTIGAINAPAVAVPQFTDPSQLREMPLPEALPAGTVAGASDTTSAPGEINTDTVDTAGDSVSPLFSLECPLTEHQVVLGEIVWMTTPAVAVRDTVTGVTQALDHQCNVLVSVEP